MPPDAGAAVLTRPDLAAPASRSWPGLILFDCDGVLIDSEIVVCRLTAEEFTALGYPVTTDQVIRRFAGRPEREMIADVEADWGRLVPPEFFARVKARVEHAYAHELQIMPGITALLDRLRTPVCVASSAYPAKLRLGLEVVGLYRHFAPNIVSASSVARGKPAPDIFIYAAGRMGAAVTDCLVIEDSAAGVHAAVAAGMRVYGFVGGTHCDQDHRQRLLAAGAEHVMQGFDELEALVPTAF